jgi:hypothetical protein
MSSGESAARVRVFLPTYRRSEMLHRAVASLRAQTMTDWVCDVHNDDPADPHPAEFIASLGDARLRVVTHERNLGAVTTFNLFFRATREPFYSMLEDDNWWEPRFLEDMLLAMEAHPDAVLAWSNQRIWREVSDGTWQDTGTCVQPVGSDDRPRLVAWGDPRQALGAIHANGAALVRSRSGEVFETPGIPQAGIEAVRERLFPHPILYVPKPLAYFAMTSTTFRAVDREAWPALQVLLLAAFVRHSDRNTEQLRALWTFYRDQPTPATNVFLFSAVVARECRPFAAYATAGDWWRWMRTLAGHPVSAWRVLRAGVRHRVWTEAIDKATSDRAVESRVRPDRSRVPAQAAVAQ